MFFKSAPRAQIGLPAQPGCKRPGAIACGRASRSWRAVCLRRPIKLQSRRDPVDDSPFSGPFSYAATFIY